MTLRRKVLVLAVVSVLVAGGIAASAALQAADGSQETGPVYSLEGAWYGTTSFPNTPIPPTPTMDTVERVRALVFCRAVPLFAFALFLPFLCTKLRQIRANVDTRRVVASC